MTKELNVKIKKHGGIKQIIRKYGFVRLSGVVLSQGIGYLRNKFYRWNDDNYGFKDKPVIGFFTGFIYLSKWKRQGNAPPFNGCFLKWLKK